METYVQQHTWGWLIYTYLFLGGLGGAVGAIGMFMDQFVEEDKVLGVFSALSGFVILAIGSLLLLADLLQPLKAVYFFRNPKSWIFWGIVFISLFMIMSLLYSVLRIWATRESAKPVAFLGMFFGFAVTIYTGFLLSFTPAIPFWHSAGLPFLFTLSAFSTGCAYLMIYLWFRGKGKRFIMPLEKLDAILIGGEMVVLFAYFLTYVCCPKAGRISVVYLLRSTGFVVGFVIVGLVVPFLAELVSIVKKRENIVPLIGVLILIGGFLLRKYIVTAGFFSYPW